MLAVQPNKVVSLTELLDELWPESPPRSALANLRSYAASLRRLLNMYEPTERLLRRGSGYLLRVEPDELDLEGFHRSRGQARVALERGDYSAAERLLDEALDLWRGPM